VAIRSGTQVRLEAVRRESPESDNSLARDWGAQLQRKTNSPDARKPSGENFWAGKTTAQGGSATCNWAVVVVSAF